MQRADTALSMTFHAADKALPPQAGDLSGVLVGRDRELSAFLDAMEQVRAGLPQIIEVTGEPGIGKTRLLAEYRRLGEEHHFRTLSGQAQEPDRGLPLAPLLDALQRSDAAVDGQSDPGVTDADVPPRIALSARATSATQPHRAARTLIEGLAADCTRSGLVLILDDLHYADDVTIRLIGDLVREAPRAPVLLVAAHRHRQAPLRLQSALTDRHGARPFRRLRLAPFSEEDAGTLLGNSRSRSWIRAVHDASGGIPLYLESLAQTSSHPHAETIELPSAATIGLLYEVERASEQARLLAHAAAVVGPSCTADLLAEVTARSAEQVVAALEELIALDLLRPTADGHRYAFRHPLLRQAIYRSTSPGRRIALHGRVAQALRRRGATVTVLAHHVQHVAQPGDLAAVSLLEEAARAIRADSLRTAAGWLRTALRLLPARSDDRHRAALLVDLAEALGLTGQLEESRETMHEALAILPRFPAGPRARAMAFCVLVERLLLRNAEANALLRAELRAMPEDEGIARATLLFELACGELSAGQSQASRDTVGQALAISRQRHVRSYQAASLGVLALANGALSDLPAANAHLDEAADILDTMLNDEFASSLKAVVWVVWAEVLLERWDNALRHLDRALTSAARAEQALALHSLHIARVIALRAQGRLAQAREAAQEALILAQRSGSGEQRAGALAMQCWIEALTGDLGSALQAGTQALGAQLPRTAGWKSMLAHRMLAEAHLTMNDAVGALAMAEAPGGPDLTGTECCSRPIWCEIMTRAALASDQLELAEQWSRRAEATALDLGLPGRSGLALLARAQVQAARHAPDAYDLACAAATTLERAGMLLDATRARLVGGIVLGDLGQNDRAAAELKSAQLAFEGYGALVLARQARVERRRLAARSARRRHDSATAGVDALTRREQQVATLVSEGLTNRHIAQRLFVTEKTVEMHLANIFTKLNVTSRVAVARMVGG